MNPVAKALWYIESHHAQEIALDDVAHCAGVSRFHLSRAFGAATGQSIMQYVRARRLSLAAQRLADGAQEILSLAIDSGYSSHEAFTRAFRDQFGRTPEEVRRQGSVHNLSLVEPFAMNTVPLAQLEPPRFVDGGVLLIAGLQQHFDCETSAAGIPGLWQRFGSWIGRVPAQKDDAAYGVVHNTDDTGRMDYLCGVEVREFTALPPEFATLRIAPRRYAVFFHAGHIAAIRNTWNAIWNDWLPASGHRCADAPFFERYGASFDPQSGNGGVELWVPLEK